MVAHLRRYIMYRLSMTKVYGTILTSLCLTSFAFAQTPAAPTNKLVDKTAVIADKMLNENVAATPSEDAQQSDNDKRAWEALSGNWKILASQWHGQWLPETIFKEFRYQIKPEGRYTIKYAELSYPAYQGGFAKAGVGQIKLNTTSTPFKIDVTPDSGPFKGKLFQGIIEIDNDVLKINMATPDTPRPTSFLGRKGQIFEVWLRQ
jgi:uncharacterized protein (TIGR03067 family)